MKKGDRDDVSSYIHNNKLNENTKPKPTNTEHKHNIQKRDDDDYNSQQHQQQTNDEEDENNENVKKILKFSNKNISIFPNILLHPNIFSYLYLQTRFKIYEAPICITDYFCYMIQQQQQQEQWFMFKCKPPFPL